MREISTLARFMARPFRLEILEDVEYLEKSLRQNRLGSQKEKLQMLWWLKSGQVKQQQELGQRLGRDTSTISRWQRALSPGRVERTVRGEEGSR